MNSTHSPFLDIAPFHGPLSGTFLLPASKSECNRALMIRSYSGNRIEVRPVSESRDSVILQGLLSHPGPEWNAQDAGTAYRFMCTWLALQNQEALLTGSDRMKDRPIGILVEALRKLGADIAYLENEGFPPLRIKPFRKQISRSLQVQGNISSQYISSLLMAAPTLPQGLRIEVRGKIASEPYLLMTWDMMRASGIQGTFENWTWDIPNQAYQPGALEVESDWSAAGYAFGLAALSSGPVDLFLPGLKKSSRQGDSILVSIFTDFGISVREENTGIRIIRGANHTFPDSLHLDFSSFPDQGQTLITLCALCGTKATFTGLESLAIKETNRLLALQTELGKAGLSIQTDPAKGICTIPGRKEMPTLPSLPSLETYEDHRMAMSLAMLSMVSRQPIRLNNPDVVQKSFPNFWNTLGSLGFGVRRPGG